jgi:hypothetical protein
MSDLTERIARARETVTRLEAQVAAAEARSEAATPGGQTGYDPAILSGIRRKPNHKADARRLAAYDREAAAWRDLEAARADLACLERRAEREAAEAAARAELTPEAIKAARFVRDRTGWHKVVRVSAKSVTVETGYSWTDRIALDKVLEVKGGVA